MGYLTAAHSCLNDLKLNGFLHHIISWLFPSETPRLLVFIAPNACPSDGFTCWISLSVDQQEYPAKSIDCVYLTGKKIIDKQP